MRDCLGICSQSWCDGVGGRLRMDQCSPDRGGNGHTLRWSPLGFDGVRVRRVCAGKSVYFSIGEAGELVLGGTVKMSFLATPHPDTQNQPSPKRVEALRGVRVSAASRSGNGSCLCWPRKDSCTNEVMRRTLSWASCRSRF